MDITTLVGLVLAIGGILLGQWVEGGHAASLGQVAAAIIVFGGTVGSVAVAFPMKEFLHGMKAAGRAFTEKRNDLPDLVAQIIELAGIARRDGVLALEQRLPELNDPFLRRAVGFIVDGVDAGVTRDALETELHGQYEEGVAAAKVWESAGGIAPTIGILGAVLGLIHTMENLQDPSKLGSGIATAFVATVYGVGSANILFIPLASKIRRKLAFDRARNLLIAEGLLSIQAGLNPRVLEEKLKAYGGSALTAAGAKKE